jgi:anti-sigma factor RsiW
MNCQRFGALLDRYVDGELSSAEANEAAAHLDECQTCRRAERELLRLRTALRQAVARHEPPPELVRRVHGRYARRPALIKGARALWERKVALPLPFVALALLMILCLSVFTVSMRLARPRPAELSAPVRRPPDVPSDAASAGGRIDLARYDRGRRAVIYTVRRDAQGGDAR